MATTNLGRVKPIHRGVYDPDFLYTPLDIVRYQGASYFCIKASQGSVPQDGEFFMAIVDGDLRYAQTAGGADANFAEAPQIDGQSLDDRYQQQEAGKGLSTNDYTDNEKSKLEGIEAEATKNATDTHLLNRENHTGTQSLETISDAGTAAAADVEDFDASGTSVAVMQAHTSEVDPHNQYARKEDLGTAAGRDATDFDPAESAANAVEAHEQELNPHSQYARLAEPNDFTHMPAVGGVPVVESGSNSDGEWTRWADGSQMCGVFPPTTDLAPSGTAVHVWQYPAIFHRLPIVNCTPYTTDTRQRNLTSHIRETFTISLCRLCYINNSGDELSMSVSGTAVGVWK